MHLASEPVCDVEMLMKIRGKKSSQPDIVFVAHSKCCRKDQESRSVCPGGGYPASEIVGGPSTQFRVMRYP